MLLAKTMIWLIILLYCFCFGFATLLYGETQERTTVATTGTVPAETTTTTTTETKNDHSIAGGLFHFIGEVIAFPFRVIGNVFDAIF